MILPGIRARGLRSGRTFCYPVIGYDFALAKKWTIYYKGEFNGGNISEYFKIIPHLFYYKPRKHIINQTLNFGPHNLHNQQVTLLN